MAAVPVATLKEKKPTLPGRGAPGVWLLFIDGRALRVPLPLDETPRTLGREAWETLGLADGHASRRHATLTLRDGVLRVEDLGSTNGTFVDGRPIERAVEVPLAKGPVVRVGRSVLLGTPSLDAQSARERLEQQLDVLANVGSTMCLVGERGSGRARLARRWLGPGAVQAGFTGVLSNGPVLLEELETLPTAQQQALVRALETTKPRPRVAVTASAEIEGLVAAHRLAPGLAVLSRPSLRVPPLRERLDELPALVVEQLSALGLVADAMLIEACLLRRWPANLRMLEGDVATAAALGKAAGLERVDATQLPEAVLAAAEVAVEPPRPEAVDDERVQRAADLLGLARKTATKLLTPARLATLAEHPQARAVLRGEVTATLLSLLERHDFQQAAVAQELGVSRTTLLKLLEGFELPRAAALTDAQVFDALAAHHQNVEAAARTLRVSVEALRQRMAQPRR